MEIVLKDKDGNDILSPRLTQWDQGVKIEIRDFYYPVDASNHQFAYLHFYNSTKRKIYSPDAEHGHKIYDPVNHTLSSLVPNQLLTEPYPITVHVYVASGGDIYNPDTSTEARTVFTATIGVDPRLKPDSYEAVDNVGEMTSSQLREALYTSIEAWGDDLAAFYGNSPQPVAHECYFDSATGDMYDDRTPFVSQDASGNEITTYTYDNEDKTEGVAGILYKDASTGILYFWEDDAWVEWSVTGAIKYCKDRADACAQFADELQDHYDNALSEALDSVGGQLNDTLNGCKIRVSNAVPTVGGYDADDLPIITFVIGA